MSPSSVTEFVWRSLCSWPAPEGTLTSPLPAMSGWEWAVVEISARALLQGDAECLQRLVCKQNARCSWAFSVVGARRWREALAGSKVPSPKPSRKCSAGAVLHASNTGPAQRGNGPARLLPTPGPARSVSSVGLAASPRTNGPEVGTIPFLGLLE